MPQTEEHDFQFRGVMVPAEVLEALTGGEISKTEFVLLIVVESFVRYKDKKYTGCYATNRYLGEILGVRMTQVSHLVTGLKRKGLLSVKMKSRRTKSGKKLDVRYMETSWSRARPVNQPPSAARATPPSAARATPPSAARATHVSRINNNKKESKLSGDAARQPDGACADPVGDGTGTSHNGYTHLNGRVNRLPSFFNGKAPLPNGANDFDRGVVVRLKKIAAQARHLSTRPMSVERQAGIISKLRSLQGEEPIKQVLRWYEHHWGEVHSPDAYCAQSFSDKFGNLWRAMQRSVGKEFGEATSKVRMVVEDDPTPIDLDALDEPGPSII